MTNGIPMSRRDVWQYSQRWLASAETCSRSEGGIFDTTTPTAGRLMMAPDNRTNAKSPKHTPYAASNSPRLDANP